MEDDFDRHVAARFDAPAYVRRAQRVQAVFDALAARCTRRRDERLPMVRSRLAVLHALAGDWTALRPLVADDEQIDVLEDLLTMLQPRLVAPVEKSTSPRVLRRALVELIESLVRFNRTWADVLDGVDLTDVNRERDGYNRWFVLEKECAVRLPQVARHGFSPLPPLTRADLAELWPSLPIPRPLTPPAPRFRP